MGQRMLGKVTEVLIGRFFEALAADEKRRRGLAARLRARLRRLSGKAA